MKKIKFEWKEIGETFELSFRIGKYANNKRTYIGIYEKNDCFCDLTINIPNYMFEFENEIIIDNDTPISLINLLVDMGILIDTYKMVNSGFARYKVMIFNYETAKEYSKELK